MITARRSEAVERDAVSSSAERPFVEVREVSKLFDTFRALDDVSLSIERGTMMALVGPSGSGKTTLLRCIAGLENPTQGEIAIDGAACFSATRRTSTPANDRNVGLIFQNYALWPHMTVAKNVEYPLARRGVGRAERRERAAQYLDLVGCGTLGERYPHQVSGGQQQRIALARTLVYEPSLVLFDEPLSNVDLMLREQLRRHIRELQRTLAFTGVFVTHDQNEAFFMGDRVAVMMDGKLLQVGSPSAVHDHPASLAVASFAGAADQLPGTLRRDGGRWLLETGDLGVLDVTSRAGDDAREGAATLAVRPQDVRLADDPEGEAVVTDAIDLGSGWEYVVQLGGGSTWRAVTETRAGLAPGAHVRVEIDTDAAYVYGDI